MPIVYNLEDAANFFMRNMNNISFVLLCKRGDGKSKECKTFREAEVWYAHCILC